MKNIKHYIPWVITFLFICWIWSNSLVQGEQSGDLSGNIARYLLSIVNKTGFTIEFDTFHFYVRKLAHFSEYALLGLLVFVSNHVKKLPIPSITFGIAVPVIDETIQHFVPDRNGNIYDVCIDISGFLCGTLFIYILYLIVRDIRQRLIRK